MVVRVRLILEESERFWKTLILEDLSEEISLRIRTRRRMGENDLSKISRGFHYGGTKYP
jgi:hypothetical protein